MPRVADELNALAVKRLTEPGSHAAGGVSGLMLQVAGGRSWIMRTHIGDRRRWIGLGSYPEVGLAEAKAWAVAAKAAILVGVRPFATGQRTRRTTRMNWPKSRWRTRSPTLSKLPIGVATCLNAAVQ